MVAADRRQRQHRRDRVGDAARRQRLPPAKPNTGGSGSAGPTVTAGGLVFVGATDDRRFRAFDAKTGKELWATKLDAHGNANPMTYQAKNGKQYVAIVAGESGRRLRAAVTGVGHLVKLCNQSSIAYAHLHRGDRVRLLCRVCLALQDLNCAWVPGSGSSPSMDTHPVFASLFELSNRRTLVSSIACLF